MSRQGPRLTIAATCAGCAFDLEIAGFAARPVTRSLAHAHEATPTRPERYSMWIRMNESSFAPEYIFAIELAFPGCEWRITGRIDWPGGAEKGWADRLAFAFVDRNPVASVAPLVFP